MRRTIAVALAALAAAGCATAPAADAPVPATTTPAAPPPPNANSIPAGTVLNVRLTQALNTATRPGDIFTVTVVEPLVAANNQTVIAEGSVITGMVTGVGATAEGQAAIRLNFLRIALDNVSHPLTAVVLDTAAPTDTLPTEARAPVTGAAVGAVLGAVIGGDLRDALVGGVLGAGAGTVISLGTGDGEAVLPEGTLLRIQTRDRVELRL